MPPISVEGPVLSLDKRKGVRSKNEANRQQDI